MAAIDQIVKRVDSEEETKELAMRLADSLVAGDVVCLYGDLGAGKTTFTRYLVSALGSPAPVSSPTFTLIHEYSGGRFPIIHVDAYRLRGRRDDIESTGLGEYLGQEEPVFIFIIEWPDKLGEMLPKTRLEIQITEGNTETERVFTFIPHGDRWQGFNL